MVVALFRYYPRIFQNTEENRESNGLDKTVTWHMPNKILMLSTCQPIQHLLCDTRECQ